jgi:hypothetical protein
MAKGDKYTMNRTRHLDNFPLLSWATSSGLYAIRYPLNAILQNKANLCVWRRKCPIEKCKTNPFCGTVALGCGHWPRPKGTSSFYKTNPKWNPATMKIQNKANFQMGGTAKRSLTVEFQDRRFVKTKPKYCVFNQISKVAKKLSGAKSAATQEDKPIFYSRLWTLDSGLFYKTNPFIL